MTKIRLRARPARVDAHHGRRKCKETSQQGLAGHDGDNSFTDTIVIRPSVRLDSRRDRLLKPPPHFAVQAGITGESGKTPCRLNDLPSSSLLNDMFCNELQGPK